MPGILSPLSFASNSTAKGQGRAKTSDAMPPNLRAPRSEAGDGKSKPVLYICASNATRTAAILDYVEQAVQKLHERAKVYEFTDHREFEEHAKHTVSVDDSMYAGVCLGLDSQNVGHYFGVMCRLALGVFPTVATHDEMHIRQVRLMLARILNFGDVPGVPLFIHHEDPSWDSFLDLKSLHAESAAEFQRIHTQGYQVILGEEKFHHTVRTHLNMADPIE